MASLWKILVALTLIQLASVSAEDRPNIVFIMADDLGWADTTLYGHTALYETPNLERLAKRGMTFNRAYTSSPLCSPTRSAVLTGLHPARTGLTAPKCHMGGEVILKASINPKTARNRPLLSLNSPNRLDTKYLGLAEVLSDAGYKTAHFGKWHLGREPYSPLEHGFDIDIPHWFGPGPAGSYVAPWKYPDFKEAYPGEHIEDRMGDEIVTYLEKQKDSKKPFFLNYWQFSVHAPFDAKQDDIDYYQKRIDPNSAQRSPTYAAMVKALDDNVGKLLDALDRFGLAENSILFFYSDNGGNMYNEIDGTTPTSNSPLRGGKGNNWDGGVRVPAIAVWPGKIEAGSRSDERITSTDFFPTILDLVSIDKPQELNFDGISIRPALNGGPLDREYIYTFFPHSTRVPDTLPNSAAVYDDEWKLLRLLHNGKDGEHEHRLFHLKTDIGETKDLAAKQPEKVQQLSAAMDQFLARTKAVYPGPNPNYQEATKTNAKPPPLKRKPKDKPNVVLIYTDDHGWPDIGAADIYDDLKTPHLNALAKSGVRATNGYSSAPQCVPSRGGLLTGKYQNRFGLESNNDSLEGFDAELSIAERLKKVGYTTGQVGKWHLGQTSKITDHGFDDVYAKNANRPCFANFSLAGKSIKMQEVNDKKYHLDACSDAAVKFIDRHADQPFFLYLAYRAPHVPLDAPEKYLARFPGPMPQRRRQALAMIAAMDDGVGRIVNKLKQKQLSENTLIFFIGDNGAPLKIHKLDAPGGGPGWDGSLNKPMNGEKGMLSEGGIRVPFLISWPGTIPKGQVYHEPIIALDATATTAELAGVKLKPGELDGINLIPQLTGAAKAKKRLIFWRWIAQQAVREGKWKLLRGGEREYLFDLQTDPGETRNVKQQNPEVFKRLKKQLQEWSAELDPPGLGTGKMSATWERYFDHYLDGKTVAKPSATSKQKNQWLIRNGQGSITKGILKIEAKNGHNPPFIAISRLNTQGDLDVKLRVRAPVASTGKFGIAWRTEDQKDFIKGNAASQTVELTTAWQELHFNQPNPGKVIHLRLHLPENITEIESISAHGSKQGKHQWKFDQ